MPRPPAAASRPAAAPRRRSPSPHRRSDLCSSKPPRRPTPRAGAACSAITDVARHARQGDGQARLHRLPRRRSRLRRPKEAAHVQPRFPTPGRRRPIRSARTRCSITNRPSSSASSIPATCASRTSACGELPSPRKCWQVKKSMMTHGCMLWGAALYNNGAVPIKQAAVRRKLQHERRAAAAADRAAADARRDRRQRASCRILDPLPRFEISQPGNILRIFERGGRFRPKSASPNALEEPGRPRAPAQQPRPRHGEPHRPRVHRPAEDAAASTRRSTSWAPTTIPATIAPAAARPATWSTPTIARRSTRGRTPSTATAALTALRDRRPDDPEGRAGPSDRAPFAGNASRPASASSATSIPART